MADTQKTVLGLRSWFSLEGGFLPPFDAMKAAKDAGADVVAFADRGELAGYFEFMEAARTLGLKVIPGVEIAINYNDDRRPALVFGLGVNGESALWELLSACAPATDETFGLPCAEISQLRRPLAVFSGIPDSHAEQMLWKHDQLGLVSLHDAVRLTGAQFGLAVAPESLDAQGIAIAKSLRGPNRAMRTLPYSPGIYREGDSERYAITRDLVFREDNAVSTREVNGQIRTVDQIANGSNHFNPEDFALLNRFAIEPTSPRKPTGNYRGLSPDAAATALQADAQHQLEAFLEMLHSRRGEKYSEERRPSYQQRLDLELGIIKECGVASSFLLATDVANALRGAGLEVRARGSAVNSLTTFLMTLSAVNPIFERLPFERFLNVERSKLPDIDLDIPASNAEQGRLAVQKALPGSFLMRQFNRATFLEGLPKALQIADPRRREFVASDLAKALQVEQSAFSGQTLADLRGKFPNFDQVFRDIRPREEFKMDSALETLSVFDGRPKYWTFHVGFGHSSDPIIPLMPAVLRGERCMVSGVDYAKAQSLGVGKIDAIACSDMDLAMHVVEAIEEKGGRALDNFVPDIGAKHLRTIFHEDRLATIPHYHRQGALCAQAGPRNFYELTDVNALIRVTGQRDLVARYCGGRGEDDVRKKLSGLPPALVEDVVSVVRPSRGVILYDEQIIGALTKVAGVGAGEADVVRSSIKSGDGIPDEQRTELTGKIAERYGCTPEDSVKVLDLLCSGGAYLFPRGHALAYAAVAGGLAVAKGDHPTEYLTGFVRHFRADEAKLGNSEFRRDLARLSYELRSMGHHVVMGLGEDLTVATHCFGESRPTISPGQSSPSSVRLGLDVFPAFTAEDLVSIKNGGQPASKAAATLLGAIKDGGDAARDAFYKELGFLPDNLHPGFCNARFLPSNLMRRPPKERDTAAMSCFVTKVDEPKAGRAGFIVRAVLTSHLGDKPMYASRLFRESNETEARRFHASLAGLSPFEPIEMHMSFSPRENSGYQGGFWNIESPTVRPCPIETIATCTSLVERRSGIGKRPAPTQAVSK